MRRRRRRGGVSTFTVGMVAIVVTIIGVYLGFTKSIPFRSHYEVKAAFKSANNLRTASPVRIAGVEVGKVTKVERASKGANGAIVTLSSMTAELAMPDQLAYGASKGAVRQMTKSMALSLAPHGIRVNAIGPGSIDTEILATITSDPVARR